jgi:arabinoxylan arabinofuranohydrolase
MNSWKRATAGLVGLLCVATLVPGAAARADNPIVQTIYTADPAPLVHNGRVYVYTGHDEDGSTYFTMREWRVYSSADMVNWTDHGSPMTSPRSAGRARTRGPATPSTATAGSIGTCR